MRVLFVISGLSLGGAERQVVLLSKELVRLGHQACIYTLTRDTTRIDELKDTGVEVVVDQKRQRLDWGVLARLRRHIRAWHPDIVQGFLYDGDFYSRVAASGMRVPVLNSERSDSYRLKLVQRIGYRATARLFDGVVANSHAGAAFARRIHRLREEQVHVVWNGIDLQEIDARLAGADAPAKVIVPGTGLKRICMIAAIKPDKDYLLALRVIRRLVDADPCWRLICVGDSLSETLGEKLGEPQGYKTEILANLRELRLEDVVTFVGHRRDVPEIIASSDMLLVTSAREGFPNVVLEAMACGTAVVSTNYSDVRQILPSAVQVVDSRSDSELAAALIHCYPIRAEIAAAQRAWVEARGSVLASTQSLLKVYEGYQRGHSQA